MRKIEITFCVSSQFGHAIYKLEKMNGAHTPCVSGSCLIDALEVVRFCRLNSVGWALLESNGFQPLIKRLLWWVFKLGPVFQASWVAWAWSVLF
ncbi:hypothetical protein U1Q18_025685 [Sarracenia purpurea var. burkii]